MQRTEVGLLPVDWQLRPLGAITKLMTNGFVGTATTHYAPEETGVLYVQGYNVEANSFNLSGVKYVTDSFHHAHQKSCLREGDLLTVQTGDVGLTTVVPPFLVGANCHALIISRLNRTAAEPRYVSHYLNCTQGRARLKFIETGTTMKHLNVGDLLDFLVPQPPLEEQVSIARALTDADALIDSLEQLLTKKRQIKQGAMQELLTGKRRLPGFSSPWIDGWLGQVIAELIAGVSVNSDVHEGGVGVPSVVKTSALKGGAFDASECKPIVPADLARAVTQPRMNTLLISRMNTPDLVGEVGYVDRDYDWLYLPDRIWMTRMRSSDCVCVRWLGYMLSSTPYKRLIGDTATGTSSSMKNIAKDALLSVPVPYPDVAEQAAIAEVLSDLDADIATLEARLTKARALKQAMAQALLTGRIRLVPPHATPPGGQDGHPTPGLASRSAP